MSSTDPITPADEPAASPSISEEYTVASPRYPHVRVRLTGGDGNAHILIGKVAVVLRREVGGEAVNAFTSAAYDCGSYEELLGLIQRTVKVH